MTYNFKTIPVKPALPAILSGILLAPASPGINLGFFAWFALVPLLWAVCSRETSPRQAAVAGWLSGFIFYTSWLYWITIVLGHYGHLPGYLSITALLLLSSYMAVYPAIFSYTVNRLQNRVSLCLAAPILWTGLDYCRSWLFSGFPWMDLAYSQYHYSYVIQVADLAGHHGLTFLIIMTNCLIFDFLRILLMNRCSSTRISLMIAGLVMILAAIYSPLRYQQVAEEQSRQPALRVSVIQGNIDQEQKWLKGRQHNSLSSYLQLSSREITEKAEKSLIIWPETAMPFYLVDSPLTEPIKAFTDSNPAIGILTGALRHSPRRKDRSFDYYNSAFLVTGSTGITDWYDKQHLVPFGEYVPFKKLLTFLAPLVVTMGDFSAGPYSHPVAWQNAKIGVLICFESIFPDLARERTWKGANILANITNDAWFGRSTAPWQHLSMAVLRAVENRRSLARAANTGFSCLIDPLGNIIGLTPLFQEASATARVPLNEEQTVFAFYGGHYFGPACLFIAIILIISALKNRLKTSKPGRR